MKYADITIPEGGGFDNLVTLKLYAASPKKDLTKLNTYAKQLRAANVLRQYLEVLLWAML